MDGLGTTHFEAVLEAFTHAEAVYQVLTVGELGYMAADCREEIRRALIGAIQTIHVPWESVSGDTFDRMRESLLVFDYVFTTNYDLLLYWSLMSGDGQARFRDYFWSGAFDATDTEVWRKTTKVLYLHGGLHLYRSPDGRTCKRVAGQGVNLLTQLAGGFQRDEAPLFVSEGTSEEKLSAIRRCDYLSFGLKEFATFRGPVVVFGHSLSNSDGHLVAAMREWGRRPIAVSIVPCEAAAIRERKAAYIAALPNAEVIFFDATSHALGDPANLAAKNNTRDGGAE